MPQTKKKKQPKNAFLLFMIHFKSQQEAKGIMFPGGMKDVAAKAEPIWKKMDLSEKWIYEEESRKEKERDKLNLENKYTTFGKSYAQVEREKNEAIEEQIRMTQEIEVTVRSLDCCTSLQTNKFYLIHVNYYCRHEKGMYTPCELALAEFNFVDGIRSVYHTLINPGDHMTADFVFDLIWLSRALGAFPRLSAKCSYVGLQLWHGFYLVIFNLSVMFCDFMPNIHNRIRQLQDFQILASILNQPITAFPSDICSCIPIIWLHKMN